MIKMKRAFSIVGLIAMTAGAGVAEENWHQFRGPTGRGHSTAKDVPTEWTADSVVWKAEIQGDGQSSPVNWGDHLFVTSAEEGGAVRNLYCLDLKTGKERWKRSVPSNAPESSHKMNSHATPTCATDGKHVYAFFGPAGIHCFDFEGNVVWSKDLGSFAGSWGVAASPILVGDVVIQNCDATGPSRLVALNKTNGEIVWETKREDKPKGGWSSPILIDNGGKKELVLNGEFGVRGYDPQSGKELWFCEAFNGRGSPVPDFADGVVYVVNGKPGNLYAVKAGGSGNVTESHMIWNQGRKAGRDLPSPAVVDGYMVVSDMAGIGSCFDAKTGELLWNERLGMKGDVAASPLVANGLVYFTSVFGGETVVVKPGKKMEVVARNSVGAKPDEVFRATLSPIQGQLLIRSKSAVYCVK